MQKNAIVAQLFPEIDQNALKNIHKLGTLVTEWNEKINLISRKDIEFLIENHLIPSLALTKICQFKAGTKVLDVGTGGGFPGLPLAICFPQAQFTLLDSIGKKIHVVQEIAAELDLQNVQTVNSRIEDFNSKFDFVLGRSVKALPIFINWVKKNLRPGHNNFIENGILYIKGGDFAQELTELKLQPTRVYSLGGFFNNQYCQEKFVLHFSKFA